MNGLALAAGVLGLLGLMLGVWAIAAAIGELAKEVKRLRQTVLGMDVHLHESDEDLPVREHVRRLDVSEPTAPGMKVPYHFEPEEPQL